MNRSFEVINRLSGKTLSTAESLTGGGIGAALTAISGSSAVYKGGIISYTDEIKRNVLGVSADAFVQFGAVSAQVAGEMVSGVRRIMATDIAVSVTGLAGPGADAFGHEVGTVFIGYEDAEHHLVLRYHFEGNRDQVRAQTIEAALDLILQHIA